MLDSCKVESRNQGQKVNPRILKYLNEKEGIKKHKCYMGCELELANGVKWRSD